MEKNTMTESLKASVTRQACIQRINRRLAREGERLRATRSDRWRNELGDYFIVSGNSVIAQHIDVEELGRELGVLRGFEELAS